MPQAGQGPDGRGVPLRVLVAVPGATALLGACEAWVQSGRLGLHVPSFLLALCAAALVGLWPSALGALVVALVDRRLPRWHERVARWLEHGQRLAAPLTVALAGVAGAWWLVPKTVAVFQRRSVDFAESLLVLWRGIALVAIPVAFVLAYLGARLIERLVPEAGQRWLARFAGLALVLTAALHLCSGPFLNYYGALYPGVVWPMAIVVVASFVPARLEGSTARAVAVGGGLALVLGLGLLGLRHAGARALLLHDTRAFPRIFDPMVAMFDGDADGDLPRWLGGTDCDGGNAEVSGLRPEVPGNGVDDNCSQGDAPAVPEASIPPVPADLERLPVVLISLDAVRADHLELYGYERETMPFLTHYAERSAAVFDRAYSPSNHTTFSMLSILSGQTPEYLMHTPESYDSGGQRFTHWIPQRFKAAGYETWAVSPALLPTGELSADASYFDRIKLGPWDHAPKNRGTHSKQIFDWLTEQLRARTEETPLFIWIHVPDPHGYHESHHHFGDGSGLGDTVNAYDDELRWSDLHVAHLLSVLNERWGESFVFALTSDHGEAFGERGEYGHGYSLYEDQIHVPLVVSAPGLESGRREEVVSLAGLGPALLELAGLSMQGTATFPSLLDPGAPVVAACPYFFGEKRYDVALVDGRYKIIRNRSRGTEVLFDLEADPDESRNLAPREPELLAELRAKLDAALETLQ